ncbi:MAG: sigma-70 family RNA polymerase sigma factor [Anaerolineales bacterium]
MRNRLDQAILERAKRFEAQALEEIFDTFSPGIYRYAFRLLGDTDLARECMSETFSRFLFALKRDGGPDNYLQAYLYRIAHNWVTDYYRSKVLANLPLNVNIAADPADEPHQVVADEMANQQLRDALTLLTPDQRQVIVLKFLEDWENESIALTLNKPIGAIKALQHRALEALHRIMYRNEDINI